MDWVDSWVEVQWARIQIKHLDTIHISSRQLYETRLFARNLIKTLFQLLNLLSKLFNYKAD